jgi:hypothetical protein
MNSRDIIDSHEQDTLAGLKAARDFDAMVRKHRRLMAELTEAVERNNDSLRGRSRSNPDYTILLSRNTTEDCSDPWRVTSFSHGHATGHREYPVLDGSGPCLNALSEFAGGDIEIIDKDSRK